MTVKESADKYELKTSILPIFPFATSTQLYYRQNSVIAVSFWQQRNKNSSTHQTKHNIILPTEQHCIQMFQKS